MAGRVQSKGIQWQIATLIDLKRILAFYSSAFQDAHRVVKSYSLESNAVNVGVTAVVSCLSVTSKGHYTFTIAPDDPTTWKRARTDSSESEQQLTASSPSSLQAEIEFLRAELEQKTNLLSEAKQHAQKIEDELKVQKIAPRKLSGRSSPSAQASRPKRTTST